MTRLPNGSLKITFRVAGLDAIKRWIFYLDPECQVLEPMRLKEMLHKDLSRNLPQCSKSTISISLLKEIGQSDWELAIHGWKAGCQNERSDLKHEGVAGMRRDTLGGRKEEVMKGIRAFLCVLCALA